MDKRAIIFGLLLGGFIIFKGIMTVVHKEFNSFKLQFICHGSCAVFIGCFLVLIGISIIFINCRKKD